MTSRDRVRQSLGNFVRLSLAPSLTVREIQRTYGSDPYKHQDSSEQDDNNQGSLLVLPEKEQVYRQALIALLISDLRLVQAVQGVTRQGHLLTQISCTCCTGTASKCGSLSECQLPLQLSSWSAESTHPRCESSASGRRRSSCHGLPTC